jgi:hypothetical protein
MGAEMLYTLTIIARVAVKIVQLQLAVMVTLSKDALFAFHIAEPFVLPD